jgi:hypothetical protein
VACRLAVSALLAGGAAPSWAEGETGSYLADTGPLRIRDQFLLGMGFLAFDPVSADIVEPGRWQVDLVLTVSNTFARSKEIGGLLEARQERQPVTFEQLRGIATDPPRGGVYLLDGEHSRTAVAVRRGIRKNLQLELVVPVVSFQGGFLDSAVESFHDVFSLAQMGRLGAPRDAFQVYVRGTGAELSVNAGPSLALGDVVVGAKYDLRRGAAAPPLELAAQALLKLPTGSEERLSGSGSTDVGVQVLATKDFHKSSLHASVGLAYLGEMESLALSPQAVLSGMLAYERALGSRTSVLGQVTVSQSPFRDLDLERLQKFTMQVTLGLKRVIGKQVLFFGITENVVHYNNSPDIGIHLGLTRIF